MSASTSATPTATPINSFNDSQFPGASQTSRVGGVGSGRKYIFAGQIVNIKALMLVLKAVQVERTVAIVFTNRGLKVTSEDGYKSLQANAFIDRNLFTRYELEHPDEPKQICIHMADFLCALSLLFQNKRPKLGGGSFLDLDTDEVARLTIKLQQVDQLKLLVQNGNDSMAASIRTFEPIPLEVYAIPFVNKIIIDSILMIDYFRSLDTSAKVIQLSVPENNPGLELYTQSERGEYRYHITSGTESIQHYECSLPMTHQYEMSSFNRILRALLISPKVSIRFDARGFMNLQFSLNREEDAESQASNDDTTTDDYCFIEYFLVPLSDD